MAERGKVKNSGKQLMGNVMMNFVGQIVPLLVAIFAIRVLIKELNLERFGVLTLVWAVIGYFSLFDFGLGRALTQIVAEKLGQGAAASLPPLILTSLASMLGFGLLGAGVISVLASPLVHRILNIPVSLQSEALYCFYLLALATPIVVLTAGVRGILEGQQNFIALNWIRLGMGLFTFIAPIAILPFSHNLVPIVLVLIGGRLIALWVHIKVCLNSSPYLKFNSLARGDFSPKLIIPLLRFGGWMTISNIVGPLMVYLDRFLIGSFISIEAVSSYVTPYEIVTKLLVIPSAICSVLFPAFATHFLNETGRVKELFSQGFKSVYLVVFPICLLFVTLSHEGLSLWINEDFAKISAPVAQWLAIGVFINCLAQVAFTLLQGIGRPDLTAKFHLLEMPMYFAAIFWGLHRFGIKGAAVAWALRVAIDAALLFFLSHRSLPGGLNEIKGALALAIVSVLVLYGAVYLTELPTKLTFLVISLSLIGMIIWFRLISPKEKSLIAKLFRLRLSEI